MPFIIFLEEFIHYDEVDIVKPPDFSIKSFFEDNDSVNGTASMLIADPDSLESSSYPVGITLSIFQKRNTRDRCM